MVCRIAEFLQVGDPYRLHARQIQNQIHARKHQKIQFSLPLVVAKEGHGVGESAVIVGIAHFIGRRVADLLGNVGCLFGHTHLLGLLGHLHLAIVFQIEIQCRCGRNTAVGVNENLFVFGLGQFVGILPHAPVDAENKPIHIHLPQNSADQSLQCPHGIGGRVGILNVVLALCVLQLGQVHIFSFPQPLLIGGHFYDFPGRQDLSSGFLAVSLHLAERRSAVCSLGGTGAKHPENSCRFSLQSQLRLGFFLRGSQRSGLFKIHSVGGQIETVVKACKGRGCQNHSGKLIIVQKVHIHKPGIQLSQPTAFRVSVGHQEREGIVHIGSGGLAVCKILRIRLGRRFRFFLVFRTLFAIDRKVCNVY